MPASVQYILPPATSSAIPQGALNPLVTRSVTSLPSRFARWILSVALSVQYILPPATSRVMPPGAGSPLMTRSSTWLPSRFARWTLSVPPSIQYILPPLSSTAMPRGKRNPVVTRSCRPVPSRVTRWILPIPRSVQYIFPPATAAHGPTPLLIITTTARPISTRPAVGRIGVLLSDVSPFDWRRHDTRLTWPAHRPSATPQAAAPAPFPSFACQGSPGVIG